MAKLVEYDGMFYRIDTRIQNYPSVRALSLCANGMEWDKPIQARACLKEGIAEQPNVK